ncbi:hypothetical protein IPN35_05115 [Candidatus Peregrinibacteria bacterium]|nr:MAG: hypothetical protein IPN35_05115 [Candidatus Peregrinibacteria bacterium]
MMKKNTEKERGSLQTLLLSELAAIGGALLGSIVALLFFSLIRSIPMITGNEKDILSGFSLFSLTFVSALSSNIFATLLMALAQQESFQGKFREALSAIFFVIIGVMALGSPLFLFLPTENGLPVSRFLLLFSALSSLLLYETYANQSKKGAYKVIAGGLLASVCFFVIFPHIIPFDIMPFLFLPVVWATVPLSSHATDRIFLSFSR